MPSYDPDPFQYLRKRALARGTVATPAPPTPSPPGTPMFQRAAFFVTPFFS